MNIDGLTKLFFAMPLFIIAMNFGFSLWLRLFRPDTLHHGDPSYEPAVSVLLPVYNEGSHVLETIESIVSCDYPHHKLEIIAIDDYSADDSFVWVQEAAKKYPGLVWAGRNEVNSGKHKTLSRALKQSTGEIVICIDSDCIFEPDVIRQLVKCFNDPDIGAVGGSVGIANVNDNIATAAQAMVYWLSFQVGKMLQNFNRRVMCISGCLFAVRRELFESIEHQVSGRNWFGISIRDGEDRYMTHQILMEGWRTYINPFAQCWTHAPDTVQSLFMQQVRWRRSGLRDFFWTLARLPSHIRVFGITALSTVLIPELFTIIWAFLLVGMSFFAPSVSTFFTSFAMFGVGYIVVGLTYNGFMAARGWHDRKIQNVIVMPVVGIWHLVDAIFTTILALFTFDNGTWGTRETPKEQK
jgi:cellulose synthase/poly-beta-1,6-N-acetylglucosamine synthase-like glycosyltransferase